MKTLLMHRRLDFDLPQELPWNESALTQDLELDTLLRAMSGNDKFLFDVAHNALLSGLRNDVNTILYRQEILKDCLRNPALVRDLYDLALDTIETKGRRWLSILSHYPSSILGDSVRLLEMLTERLRTLRNIAGAQGFRFEAEGFRALFTMIEKEITDEYLAAVRNHLAELKFRRGMLLSADLGEGNEGGSYVLRQPWKKPNWFQRILGLGPAAYTFHVDPRDQAGGRILSDMENSGINLVANALAQSADHVLSFFETLRRELAFYLGCLNLHGRLAAKGEPVCFPRPFPAGERKHRFTGLYDVCLSLLTERRVVGNDADVDGKNLVIITGANQGGKSVFLRAIGLAQMMMQCGMFVPAESFEAELCTGLFTHYKREEDPTMKNGKLDEELARMSDVVDHLAPNSMLLCNESFAATNEREGSEIARQIVSALVERRIKVFFVTHLYEFARGQYDRMGRNALFLRAERKPDGTRPFKLAEAEPLETSYGEDLYREVFSVGTKN